MKIIDAYYPADSNVELRQILLKHSRCVASLACEICQRHCELNLEETFVYEAAMLHDIGIVRCDAPGIHCFGTEPYLRHGIVGAQMLEEYAMAHPEIGDIAPYARVCSHHTGTGLTAKMIRKQMLPLPEMNFVPETMEEKIICYADKFYSKTRLDEKKELKRVRHSLSRYGQDCVDTFDEWHRLFG